MDHPVRGLDLALHIPSGMRARGAAGIRPGAGRGRGTTCPPPQGAITTQRAARQSEEGCPMSSIVYLVGAVVIIGFVLKMIGVY